MTTQTLIAAGALFATVILIATFVLPGSVTVTRNKLIEADSATLYQLVSSNRGYQQFNPYKLEDPNLKIELFGPEQGVGSGFRFDGKGGKGSQTVAAVEENSSVSMQIDMGAMGKPTQQFTFKPTGTGTYVTWEMQASFGHNPIARVFGLFMDRMIGGTFESGLDQLARVAKP